jgi:hypothetical protein
VKRAIRFLALAVLTGASALAQDAVVTRAGDGTVAVPTRGGVVTITVATHASRVRIPPRGVRLNEKQVERFLRERAGRENEWT